MRGSVPASRQALLQKDEEITDRPAVVPECTEEFAAAKVDIWCAWTALTAAAQLLRRRTGLQENAPILLALDRVNGPVAERAAAEFIAAATTFEGARVALGEARMR
ncbi:hypothetical protein [Actinomadura sp. 3N508]|uniref:hypothetical protein n=1 Tax=Actinomadura sp. 3N508 TaxID=3375153 RepID=UPI0037A3E213